MSGHPYLEFTALSGIANCYMSRDYVTRDVYYCIVHNVSSWLWSCSYRLVPLIMFAYCSILLQALTIPKIYYSQQETYYSDPNRRCYGKIVHGTPTLTFLAA